jgi:hypothetical protein
MARIDISDSIIIRVKDSINVSWATYDMSLEGDRRCYMGGDKRNEIERTEFNHYDEYYIPRRKLFPLLKKIYEDKREEGFSLKYNYNDISFTVYINSHNNYMVNLSGLKRNGKERNINISIPIGDFDYMFKEVYGESIKNELLERHDNYVRFKEDDIIIGANDSNYKILVDGESISDIVINLVANEDIFDLPVGTNYLRYGDSNLVVVLTRTHRRCNECGSEKNRKKIGIGVSPSEFTPFVYCVNDCIMNILEDYKDNSAKAELISKRL